MVNIGKASRRSALNDLTTDITTLWVCSMHELHARSGELQRDLVFAELRRIETLQRKWNALTFAERAKIAKASPDLTLFFQPRRMGARPVQRDGANVDACSASSSQRAATRRRQACCGHVHDVRSSIRAAIIVIALPQR